MKLGIWLLLAVATPSLAQSTWTGNGSGNWSDATDWSGGIPNNINAVANLAPSASNTFVDVNESVFLGALNISSSAYLYDVYGPDALSLVTSSGSAQITNSAGNNIILAPVSLGNDTTFNISASSSLTLSDSFSARGTNITKSGAGSLAVPDIQANSINITQGTVQVRSNGTASGLSVVHSFSLTSGASFDLTNNVFIYDYLGADPLVTMTSEVAAAYDQGKWDKPGITSSAASLGQGTTLGIAEASTLGVTSYDNQQVPNSVIVAYTWCGDANLDGVVNGADLTFMQKNQKAAGTGWTAGDFNYDGKINADDFSLYMLGSTKQTGMLAVPEPGVTGMMVGMSLAFARRRLGR